MKPDTLIRSANVTVLMGVLNGARHLPAQLHSLGLQSHLPGRVIFSDDGSTDGSVDVLKRFKQSAPFDVEIQSGPQQGFAQNYLNLLATSYLHDGYIALADQDDIWLPEKIERAVDCLTRHGTAPALYCGSRVIWHPDMPDSRVSPPPRRPPSFKNALVENIATGNTIVLNPAAAQWAARFSRRCGPIFAHDWWLYLMITGLGGTVIHDTGPPQILYRQHSGNQIGEKGGLSRQVKRKLSVMKGLFADRIDRNLASLETISDHLTPENQTLLRRFAQARHQNTVQRLKACKSLGIHRQTGLGQLGFWGATALGRI